MAKQDTQGAWPQVLLANICKILYSLGINLQQPHPNARSNRRNWCPPRYRKVLLIKAPVPKPASHILVSFQTNTDALAKSCVKLSVTHHVVEVAFTIYPRNNFN